MVDVARCKASARLAKQEGRRPPPCMRDVQRVQRAKKPRHGCRCAKENPTLLDHANNVVGDFVNDHPWISALIGGTALGAAGYIGVLLTQAVIRSTPSSSTITTSSSDTDSAKAPTSSTSSSGSPTFDASKAITVYVGSAGKYVPVGASVQFVDPSTGKAAEAGVDAQDVLAFGPSLGQFVAVAQGTVKVTTALGTTTIVVQPAAAAGIASSPRKLPRVRGLTSLLMGT